MDRDRDRSGIPMIELDPKVVGEEVSGSSLMGCKTLLVEGSLARRTSPVAGVKLYYRRFLNVYPLMRYWNINILPFFHST